MGLTLNLDEGDSMIFTLETGEEIRATYVRKGGVGRRAKMVIDAPRGVDIRREMGSAETTRRLKRA